MNSEGSNKFLQNNTVHENARVSLTPHQKEAGHNLESEKYKNLSKGDIWKRVDAEGKFVEALYISSIYFLGEKKAAVTYLESDLRLPEDPRSLDVLMKEKGGEWNLEYLRQYLITHKYVLERAGTVSETAYVKDEVGKSPFVHLEKPGDKAHYIRKKSWLEGGGPDSVIITVTRVKDGYQVLDPEMGKDARFYSIPAIDNLALAEGWVSDDFPDTVPEARENVLAPPKFFDIQEKKEVRRTWKKDGLLNAIAPDEFFVLESETGGTIRYVRRGDDFVDVQSNSNDTQGIIRRLNNGWRLVEEPGSDFMAGRETRQFFSGDASENGAQYTVAKKTDGYYIKKDKVWTPQLVRDESVFAGFRNSKLQDDDKWQGPLTKVQMLERIRAEQWEPVVEINSLEDFLRDGGPEAVLKVSVLEEIIVEEWREFEKAYAVAAKKLAPEQMIALRNLWDEEMLPEIESMMTEDLMKHDGLPEEQAKRVVEDLSAQVSRSVL